MGAGILSFAIARYCGKKTVLAPYISSGAGTIVQETIS